MKPVRTLIKTSKVPTRSRVIKTEVVCPNDTNPLANCKAADRYNGWTLPRQYARKPMRAPLALPSP